MEEFAFRCKSLKEWEERKRLVRSVIALKTGVNPCMPRGPAECVETKVFSSDDCTVKNVYWRTLDDYYVAGNIYLPEGVSAPLPAVMLPHGHFEFDRFNTDSTILAVSLAKLGCVAVTYDMVGKGEDKGTPHDNKYSNAVQLHNSIRILDYICSLGITDKKRIAVTGASGGGSQTMMLAGIDSRIAAAVPVCMLSAHFNGGCQCERGMNYFAHKRFKTNNAEITAMFAPKDLLVVSIGTDWTKNTPEVEFPYLQSVYRLYDAGEKVKNAHFAREEHDYGPSKRLAAARFLAEVFGLDFGKYNDNEGFIPSAEDLRSYGNSHPKPEGALTDPKAIYEQMLVYYSSR